MVMELPTLISGNDSRGYTVYRFDISNTSSKKQIVDMEYYDSNYSGSVKVCKRIELTPNDQREEKIYVPNLSRSRDYKFNFKVNGSKLDYVPYSSNKVYRSSSWDRHSFLLDKKILTSSIDSVLRDPGLDYRTKGSFNYNTFDGSLKEMDSDWITYTNYDFLFYLSETFEEMPFKVRDAILSYVKAGGHLVLLGEPSNKNLFDTAREMKNFNGDSSGLKHRYSVGLGVISIFDKDLLNKVISTPEKTTTTTTYSKKQPKPITDEYFEKQKYKAMYKPMDILNALDLNNPHFSIFGRYGNNDFRVKNYYDKDYRAFGSIAIIIILVIIFAFFIGPVNFFYLKHIDRKILIFATVPIISVICCSIIFVYFLLFEYGRLDIYRQSFTLLDEKNNTSITYGAEIIVSGHSMNEALSFPLSSVVMPDLLYYKRGSSFSNQEIRLDKTQNFTRDWIKAKIPLAYSITSIKQDRSRLDIKQKSDSIEVLNGLGADIEALYIISDDGNYLFNGESIASGKTKILAKNKKRVTHRYLAINYNTFLSDYNDRSSIIKSMKRYAEDTLKPGEYIAYLKTNPYMKQEMDWRASIKELGCFVHGTLKQGAGQ